MVKGGSSKGDGARCAWQSGGWHFKVHGDINLCHRFNKRTEMAKNFHLLGDPFSVWAWIKEEKSAIFNMILDYVNFFLKTISTSGCTTSLQFCIIFTATKSPLWGPTCYEFFFINSSILEFCFWAIVVHFENGLSGLAWSGRQYRLVLHQVNKALH